MRSKLIQNLDYSSIPCICTCEVQNILWKVEPKQAHGHGVARTQIKFRIIERFVSLLRQHLLIETIGSAMLLRNALLSALFPLSGLCAVKEVLRPEECTITHPTTGEFYDLRGLARHPDEEKAVDWHANGFDYTGGNFSLNICAPLITKTTRISKTQNISAIYTNEDEKMFSIGRTSKRLRFRGKKLILQYEGGSECPGDTSYRKSSLILFTCDPTMVGTASVNFIGESNDCSYFFEYKTSRACATTRDVESALSPGMVFLIILMVAFGVYLIGGCMYSRTVLHQSGWRQMPNYELWQSLFGTLPVASSCRDLSN